MKRPKDLIGARLEFYEQLAKGELDLRQASRRARKIAGMSQAEYAKLIGIAPRVLIDFERGVGNPTLKTLEKIGAPFGLVVTYRHR